MLLIYCTKPAAQLLTAVQVRLMIYLWCYNARGNVYVYKYCPSKKGNLKLFQQNPSASLVDLHTGKYFWAHIKIKSGGNSHPPARKCWYHFPPILYYMFIHSGWPQLVSMWGWDSSENEYGKIKYNNFCKIWFSHTSSQKSVEASISFGEFSLVF